MTLHQRRLRTLQIGHGWDPETSGSGLDRVFYSLIHHFPDTNVQARGIVVSNSERQNSNHRHNRIVSGASESTPIPKRLYDFRVSAKELFAKCEFNLVASHFPLYAFSLLDILPRFPFVCHFHGPWALETKAEGGGRLGVWMRKRIERLVYDRADCFIVLSKPFRRILTTHYGVDASMVRIVPGGVDSKRFAISHSKAESREQLGWPNDRPIILSVRRLVHRVGLLELIEAMPRVVRRVPDANLFIAGKGPLAPELEARIHALELEQHVKLLGFVPDEILPLAYRAADLSVIPTQQLEGFGLVAVESLAAGTPPLVTPVGGLPDVVRDLSDNLIMEGTSVDQISEHLIAALRGSLRLPDPIISQRFAASRYDWSIIAQKVRSVYDKVI